MKKIAVLLLILLALPISMRAQDSTEWVGHYLNTISGVQIIRDQRITIDSLESVIDSLKDSTNIRGVRVPQYILSDDCPKVYYLDTAYDKGFVKDSTLVYVDPNYEISPGAWTCMMGYYDWRYYYRAVIDTVWVTKPGNYQTDKPED